MFPGFITSYKDNDNYIHLYFFPGIDENGDNIYNPIDLKDCKFKFSKSENNDDHSVDYKFNNKNIIKLNCNLIEKKTNKNIFETLIIQ